MTTSLASKPEELNIEPEGKTDFNEFRMELTRRASFERDRFESNTVLDVYTMANQRDQVRETLEGHVKDMLSQDLTWVMRSRAAWDFEALCMKMVNHYNQNIADEKELGSLVFSQNVTQAIFIQFSENLRHEDDLS